MAIMLFANALSHDLSCGEVFNRRQIPNRPSVITAAQVSTPDLVRLCDGGMLFQEIAIGMMRCNNGAIACDVSPRWA